MDEIVDAGPPEDKDSSREALPPSTKDASANERAADEANADAKGAPKPRKKRKLTLEKQTEICAMISVGCSLRTAARLAGCSDAAVRNLARRDDDFARRFREAAIRREVFPLRNIINASQTRWRAAAWYLTRLNPEEYGCRKPETVTPQMLKDWTGALGSAIMQAIEDDATLARIADVLNRLAPKKDRREELERVTMPPDFDAGAQPEGTHADRA